jgi:hypothetical protein
VAAAAGEDFSLAVTADGTVWGWGYNGDGELGANASQPTTPIAVPGVAGATAVAAGASHALALRNDGTVWSWGDNSFGQLGHGSAGNTGGSNAPAAVVGLAGATGVAAGRFHSLAVKNDGTVWAWGQNSDGRLGNGSTADSAVPVQASGLTNATAVAAGGYHSLAYRSDGTVWAWGYNFYGELGNGGCADSDVPVQASGPAGAETVAAGFIDSLAVVGAPAAAVSPSNLAFGNQKVGTTSAAQTVTITDSGQAPLTVGAIATSGDFAQTNTCGALPATLAPGASCAVAVTFAPTTTGARTGALTVTDNAPGSPQAVALSGTGTAPAASLSPTSLNFGTVKVGTTSAPQTVTLTNTGTATLVVSGVAASGDFAAVAGAGCASLAPGARCTITVTFAPTAAGTRAGALSVADDAPGSPQTVALSGSGKGKH